MKNLLTCCLGTVAFGAFSETLATQITDFQVGGSGTIFFAGGSSASSNLDPGSLGGRTDYFFSKLTGDNFPGGDNHFYFAIDPSSTGSLPSEVLTIGSSAFNTGLGRFSFDGNTDSVLSPTGLGSIDLTDGGTANAFLAGVRFNDVASEFSVTLYSHNGTETATGSVIVPGMLSDLSTVTDISLPFSTFTTSAGFSFSQVSAVGFQTTTSAGGDLILDYVRTGTGQVNPVAPTAPNLPAYSNLPEGALLIDGFGSGSASIYPSAPVSGSSSSTTASDVLGGAFRMELDGGIEEYSTGDAFAVARGSGPDEGAFHLASQAFSGNLSIDLRYDSVAGTDLDPAGLGSIDLTDGGVNDAFLFGILFSDAPFDITMWVYSGGGLESSQLTFEVPAQLLGGASLYVPFADFAGNADFTDVSALEFSFDTAFGQDLAIDYLAAAPVPEPAGIALLFPAVATILARRRR